MDACAADLSRAVARLNRRLRQERGSELTPTQLATLGSLNNLGPTTPGALAAAERVSPPSVTRIVSSLVDLGMVDRAPHPDDGRQVLVSISQHGAEILAGERERRDAWLRQRLGDLDPADRDLLADAVRVMTKLAES